MTLRLAPSVLLLAAASLAACSSIETLPVLSELPKVPVPDALQIEHAVDTPTNLVERALSACDKRIEDGEAACVKRALAENQVTVPRLVAMLPGCRAGQVCHLTYTTQDRVGYVPATASLFVVHWRVDFDLRKPAASADAVPITVVQV